MQEGWSRLWVLRDGAPVPTRVRLGSKDDDHVEVIEGAVSAGDPVVVDDRD
jgi:HlyD family secretion protein